RPQLHLHAFSKGRVLVESEVPLFVGWTHQRIATQVAEVPRTRNTVGCEPCRPSVIWIIRIDDHVQGRAWHSKRTEVDVVGWITFVVDDGSDDIRAVITFAAAAVVILRVVVQGKGRPSLQSDGAIEGPAVLDPLHAPTPVRQFVTEHPGKAMGD